MPSRQNRPHSIALGGLVAFVVCLGTFAGIELSQATPRPVVRVAGAATETVFIRNSAQRYFSDGAIREAIPAWEKAANTQFAPVWRTPHVRIVLLKHGHAVPAGGILATFKQKGSIQGALAFHTSFRDEPQIVVYAGTDSYYGYSNSESFTHELFEMLADHFVAGFNIGNLTPYYYIGKQPSPMPQYAPWFNEVSDPVEKYGYKVDGIQISDWITPNWFNDPVSKGGFDYMGLVQYPYQVLKGGYAQYVIDGQDYVIENFHNAGRDASGFFKAEHETRFGRAAK